jgi:hypothetical protein
MPQFIVSKVDHFSILVLLMSSRKSTGWIIYARFNGKCPYDKSWVQCVGNRVLFSHASTRPQIFTFEAVQLLVSLEWSTFVMIIKGSALIMLQSLVSLGKLLLSRSWNFLINHVKISQLWLNMIISCLPNAGKEHDHSSMDPRRFIPYISYE